MTAISIVKDDRQAWIFTDAACYGDDGVLLGFTDKVHEVGRGRMFLAGRGNVWFMSALAKTLEAAGFTIDDIERIGDACILGCFEAAKPTITRWGHAHSDVFLVGISGETGRPKIAQWSSAPPTSVARFSMVDNVLAPEPDAQGYRRIREQLGAMTKGAVDWPRLGLITILENRYTVGVEQFGAAGQFLVGGHIQRTTIKADGFEKDVVHRWPEDTVGSRIRPTPRLDQAAASTVIPLMSRADRRRLAKTSRRATA